MQQSEVYESTAWLEDCQAQLENHLKTALMELDGTVEPTLLEAMRYSLLNGGKRLRACLVLAVGHAVGVQQAHLLPCAAAIEAMHAYSLVHDDMPSMDNDTLRRGKPTCHVQFGQAMALLTGDALQTLAFQWLSGNAVLSSAIQLKQVQELARGAGALGMANGQAIDLQHVGQTMSLDALKEMHARKTGDLILASVRLGYLPGSGVTAQQAQALDEFAMAIGLAYQVVDDILDVESSSEQLGKTSGKDAAANKPTMASLLGLDQAKALLFSLGESARAACGRLDSALNGPLLALIDLIVERKS